VPFNIRRADQFSMRAVEWAWENILPTNVFAIMVGAPGSNKSTLATELAAKWSIGALEGDFEGRPVNVLYIGNEDSIDHTTLPRLRAAGGDEKRVWFVDRDEDLVLPRDIEVLAKLVRENDIRVIIIDPLATYIDSKISTQGHYQKTLHALAPLASMAQEVNGVVLGMTHTVKNTTGTATIDATIGSRAFTSVGRVVLAVGKIDPTTKVVGVIKSNVGPTHVGWRFITRMRDDWRDHTMGGKKIKTVEVVWHGPASPEEIDRAWQSASSHYGTERLVALLKILGDGKAHRTRDVIAALQTVAGVKRSTVYDAILDPACQQGLVERDRAGSRRNSTSTLQITAAGLEWLATREVDPMDMPPAHEIEDVGPFEDE
jgi:hypothetical protein